MLKIAAIGFGLLCGLGTACADEVDVHAGPGPAVVAPDAARDTSKTVVHETDGAGCASKTVHKENDAGDSKTVSQTNC